eukprot:tig00020960_g16543.t1
MAALLANYWKTQRENEVVNSVPSVKLQNIFAERPAAPEISPFGGVNEPLPPAPPQERQQQREGHWQGRGQRGRGHWHGRGRGRGGHGHYALPPGLVCPGPGFPILPAAAYAAAQQHVASLPYKRGRELIDAEGGDKADCAERTRRRIAAIDAELAALHAEREELAACGRLVIVTGASAGRRRRPRSRGEAPAAWLAMYKGS